MLLMIVIGAVTYFSIALPTISGIDNRADIASLKRRFLRTIYRAIDSTYQPGRPARARLPRNTEVRTRLPAGPRPVKSAWC